ncbi:MAG: hypothetical protein CVV33_01055 [Methanomicrobiales archaeon HGW-Methanomicrobiales-4]|nr:MAG: hypothetical protein CVV33_01055 [Methanomicrobiales archaeon HGW-Methanomicrobiales-4]
MMQKGFSKNNGDALISPNYHSSFVTNYPDEKRLSILLVVSDPVIREEARKSLESDPIFVVTITECAIDAIHIFLEKYFQIIISDFEMPDMDGIAFLKYLRQNGDNVPFIIFTSEGHESAIIEALNYGGDLFIRTHTGFHDLPDKVRSVILSRRSEIELVESQKRIADIIDFLPDATFAINTTGVVIAWNRAIENLTSISKKDILNTGNYGYALPFYHERRPILIDLALMYDENQIFQSPFIQKDGDQITTEIFIPHLDNGIGKYLWVIASPLYDSNGNISGAIESIRDITFRKQVEDALRDSENRFRRICEGLTDYQYTVRVEKGVAVSTTHGLASVVLTGYSAEEFDRDPYLWIRMVHDTDRERVIQHFNEVLSGKPVKEIEYRIRRKDGQIHWMRDTSILQYDTGGILRSYDGVIKDISDRKEVEQALRESEERFHSMFERHDSVMLLIEPETGMIVDANLSAERFYGKSRRELCSMPISDINTLSPEEIAAERIKAVQEKRNFVSFEHRISNGEIRIVEVYSSPIDMEGKKILFSIIHDVTERRQAEEALRIHAEIERNMSEAVCLIRASDEKIVYCNKSFEGMFGYKSGELIEKDVCITYASEDQNAQMKAEDLMSSLKNTGTWNGEVLSIKKDRTLFWCYANILSFEHPRYGRVWLSMYQDIDTRKKTDEYIRHLTEFQKSVITNALVWLIVLDLKGNILLWNKAAEEISGYMADEVIGKNDIWKELYPDKEYRREITETISQIIGNKKYLENFETIIQSKKGYTKVISWNTKGISDKKGRVFEYIAIGVDVTDRHEAEEALKESDRYHRGLIEASIDPFETISSDGKITDINIATEKITGYAREDLIGSDFADCFTEPEKARTEYLKVFEQGQIHNYPLEIRNRNGKVTPVLFNASLYYDKDGNPHGIFASSRDITEQKKGEEARREAIQKLRLLTSLTRHDIFNQLSVIEILLEMALQSSDPDKIQTLLSQAQEARGQIEATIGFTREYENFGIVSSTWQRIYRLIKSATVEIAHGKVTVFIQIPENLEVYADPIIRKVFSPLMDNAIRHGEKISNIRFFCTEKGDSLLIICEDDGVGIPFKEKILIFDHGYGKHTGIGLFLVWEILSITGLSIRETGVPGKGARFEILVPAGKFRREGL